MGPQISSSTGVGSEGRLTGHFQVPDLYDLIPNQIQALARGHFRPHPQYGWDFPEEIPEKFRKDPGNALRVFPDIPLESTAGNPQALSFKAFKFEASAAFPDFSPLQYSWGCLFFSEGGPGEGL